MHGEHSDGECVVFGQCYLVPHDRDKEFFSDLEEKDLQMNIEFGDDRRYNVTGIGIVTF